MRNKLIHEADDERIVRQLLEGASNAGALMFGNAVGPVDSKNLASRQFDRP